MFCLNFKGISKYKLRMFGIKTNYSLSLKKKPFAGGYVGKDYYSYEEKSSKCILIGRADFNFQKELKKKVFCF